MLAARLCPLLGLAAALAVAPAFAEPPEGLSIAAEFDAANPPGNVTATAEGRIFMSLHGFYGPQRRVVEVGPQGDTAAYPNEAWAGAPGDQGIGLNFVLGLRADETGVLWMLDNPGPGQSAKLIGWNTVEERLHRVIYLDAPFVPDNAFLNDLAVDLDGQAVYIADTTGVVGGRNNAALLVIDLATGQARRVLEGHPSVIADVDDVAPEGMTVAVEGEPVRVGVNPIALGPEGDWIYYGPMSGTRLYRVRTADLRDASLSPDELASRVEVYAERPVSDGMIIDGAGNIYITDINASAIGVIDAQTRAYSILFQDDVYLSWPDGFGRGPDGTIYVTVNQLHRSPGLRSGERAPAEPPFYLLAFKALAEAGGR